MNPFVICKAAAGSGKTFTLVKEYLKLALAGPEEGLAARFRGILAITFTNKAANEMKSRIMSELEAMATDGIDPAAATMGATLLHELNELPLYKSKPLDATALRNMARQLLTAVLHHYSDLSVFTIDSFMHRIVRTFAHDLDRPVNFEVMIDQKKMIEEAVEGLMSKVGTEGNAELTALLRDFANSRMDDERGYDLDGQLKSLASELFREGADEHVKALSKLSVDDFRRIHGLYLGENRRFREQLAALGAEAMALLHGAALDASHLAGKSKGVYPYFKRLEEGAVEAPGSTVTKAFENAKLVSTGCPTGEAIAIERLTPQLTDIYNRLQALLAEGLTDYNTRSLLLQNLYSTALLNRMGEELAAYSRDNEVVHLSEFNKMINTIVQNEPAPFIFERLGNRYHHFLIDEFQDTSVLQWHNLVPLVENGVAQRHESLVVGDGKQAIYRFRQGDVRQFVDLPHVSGMPLHGASLAHEGNYTVQYLVENHRTARAVVEFNNLFFSWVVRNRYAHNPLAQRIYLGTGADGLLPAEGDEELRQRPVKQMEGYVGIDFVDKDDAEALCASVLQTIERLTAERGYALRDIMVLTRNNSELARIGNYLRLHGVRQTSSESFLLRSSDGVMAVVAALRLLRDGSDRVAAADLLTRLQRLRLQPVTLDEAFLATESFDLPALLRRHGFDFRPPYLLSLGLYDCCEELLRTLHLDGIDTPYLAALLNNVAAFTARHRQDIGEFLDWFDDHETLSATTSDEIDAVRMLTIHKAKGLEAPVVICPLFFERSYAPRMWVDVPAVGGGGLPTAFVTLADNTATHFDALRDDDLLQSEVDNLNILYVALTRPREQLYIVCPDPHALKTRKEGDLRYPSLISDFVDACRPAVGDEAFCHPAGDSRRGPATVELIQLSYADWTAKVCIASPSESALSKLQDDRIRFGLYAHDLLASVTVADDVDDAVARFVQRQELEEDWRERLAALAHEVTMHPATERFFRKGLTVRTECELMDDGRLLRPDRVVFGPDGVWVVDFKTGAELDEHHDQVRGYCRAIARMGHAAVRGCLVYLLPELKVVEVE